VQELRSQAELSQAALADRAGLTPPRIAEIESGRHDPVWGDIRRIAGALDISLEHLTELAERYDLEREV
jgi:transcriptional regulator with XRE-family HTH domain